MLFPLKRASIEALFSVRMAQLQPHEDILELLQKVQQQLAITGTDLLDIKAGPAELAETGVGAPHAFGQQPHLTVIGFGQTDGEMTVRSGGKGFSGQQHEALFGEIENTAHTRPRTGIEDRHFRIDAPPNLATFIP